MTRLTIVSGLALLALAVGILFTQIAADERESDDEHRAAGQGGPVSMATAQAYEEIDRTYQRDVEPIVRRACFDCHSDETAKPWYYQIPGVRQMIDSSVREGREHLDFGTGFPFRNHEGPAEGLKEIAETIREDSMPPLSYWLMHRDTATLNLQETQTVLAWSDKSQRLLGVDPSSARRKHDDD